MHGIGDEPAVQTRSLSIRYGRRTALRDVTLTVQAGELVALVGPNGAGKTSLLHALAGALRFEGEAVVHGRLALVPQRAELDPEFPITVGQVVATAWRGRGRDRQAVHRALARVGLDGLERRPIAELSGGQLQRCLLARAIAAEPHVLLLDEPLSGVDAQTASAVLGVVDAMCAAGATALVSTHDLALVRERFPRCVCLSATIVGDGAPEEILDPAGVERAWTG